MVVCPSGLRSTPRKRVTAKPVRGFKSLRHRQSYPQEIADESPTVAAQLLPGLAIAAIALGHPRRVHRHGVEDDLVRKLVVVGCFHDKTHDFHPGRQFEARDGGRVPQNQCSPD